MTRPAAVSTTPLRLAAACGRGLCAWVVLATVLAGPATPQAGAQASGKAGNVGGAIDRPRPPVAVVAGRNALVLSGGSPVASL